MKRSIFPILMVAAAVAFAFPGSVKPQQSGWFAVAMAQDGGDHSMAKLRVVMNKLRDAMASMKDLDDLEAAGMPKKDVDRMRNAMQLKIQQMMDEAMTDIRSL